MSLILKSVVQAGSREKALEAFWAYHELYPGNRRASPQSFITVKQVKPLEGNRGGMWVVLYTVPSRVLKAAHERRAIA